jgi:endonuclease/exonuclease/phosphatase family metal-dependent hydrolase
MFHKSFISLVALSLICLCACSKDNGTSEIQKPDQPKDTTVTPPSVTTTPFSLRVGTFNIRCLSSSDTGYKNWEFRKGNCVKIVNDNSFDVIGFQEVTPSQGDYLKSKLTDYTFHLIGRDDGESAGEAVGVAFKTSKYSIVKKGRFFLSPTPDVVSSPYPGWVSTDPGRNRVVAWTILKDKATGRQFMYMATHLEVSKTDAVTIRLKSAELICSYQSKINPDGLPCILVGDMNSKPTEDSHVVFKKSFTDSYFAAEALGVRYGYKGTFNDHVYTPENYLDNQGLRIDYIYYHGSIDISKYQVVSDKYDSYYPSDHCPVYADLKVK